MKYIPSRRAPPPIRSSIPKQAVEMPSIVNESGSIPQFCFGSFSDERDQEAQQDYKGTRNISNNFE